MSCRSMRILAEHRMNDCSSGHYGDNGDLESAADVPNDRLTVHNALPFLPPRLILSHARSELRTGAPDAEAGSDEPVPKLDFGAAGQSECAE